MVGHQLNWIFMKVFTDYLWSEDVLFWTLSNVNHTKHDNHIVTGCQQLRERWPWQLHWSTANKQLTTLVILPCLGFPGMFWQTSQSRDNCIIRPRSLLPWHNRKIFLTVCTKIGCSYDVTWETQSLVHLDTCFHIKTVVTKLWDQLKIIFT